MATIRELLKRTDLQYKQTALRCYVKAISDNNPSNLFIEQTICGYNFISLPLIVDVLKYCQAIGVMVGYTCQVDNGMMFQSSNTLRIGDIRQAPKQYDIIVDLIDSDFVGTTLHSKYIDYVFVDTEGDNEPSVSIKCKMLELK